MPELCRLCSQIEDKQENPGLVCNGCNTITHLKCITWWNPPGNIVGDVFFDYTCSACSPTGTDVFNRSKISWMIILTLVLYHLQHHSYGISRHGFFHYKTHIGSFVERYWQTLFHVSVKQRKNWLGGLAGVLSVYNGVFFQSGSTFLGETGWWKLLHKFSPAVIDQINITLSKVKAKKRYGNLDEETFKKLVESLGYEHLLVDEPSLLETAGLKPKPELESQSYSYYSDCGDSSRLDGMSDEKEASNSAQEQDSIGIHDSSFSFTDIEDIKPSNAFVLPSDTSSNQSYHPFTAPNYDSDSRSRSPLHFEQHTDDLIEKVSRNFAPSDRQVVTPSLTSNFSHRNNSLNPMIWLEQSSAPAITDKEIARLSEYEEIQLLKEVDSVIVNFKSENERADMRRFKAKLKLRRLQRNRHLPVFDLDRTVKRLAGYSQEESNAPQESSDRVLDRYQRLFLLDNLSGTVLSASNCSTVLVGNADLNPFRSPSSGCILKPFIRRDSESTPLWMALTTELMLKANRKKPDYVLPPRATIDYSYVRPHHLAAINNLCAQYFWPGVDLSETLHYPEHSCVVLYKKIVIGFAFLVPDARPNEAYISFILTRPEWRRAHIATFMLYHLLQTCTGKDVTMHVSPTNPAIFLYQKFGFKVEELVQNFYEKYFEVNSKDCKHALFLRLTR